MESLEHYWSIVLYEGFVNASLWTIDADRVRIIATGTQQTWENSEDLILALNSLLEEAVENYPENAPDPEKTVFAVPPSWVKDGTIIKDKLSIIRNVCTKLKLAPSGFVVLPEAIAHGKKHSEGAPLNSLVVGISGVEIDVSLFSLGNLIGTIVVGRSENLVGDIAEALARFKSGQHFPSRFIVYGEKDTDLENILQQLIAYDWEAESAEVKFMHTPKFESSTSDELVSFAALAGASEIVDISELVFDNEDKAEEDHLSEENIASENNNVEQSDLDLKDIGFVVGGDVAEEKTIQPAHTINPHQEHITHKPKLKLKMPKLNLHLPKKHPSLPKQKLPVGNSTKTKRMFFVLMALLLLVGGGLGAAWWYLPKAEIIIYVSPKSLHETHELVMGEDVQTSASDFTLNAEVVTLDQTGERTTGATGTKIVGEKAVGEVTIRNGTASGINLKAGTVLKGPNDLLFTLDNSASVSAATSPSQPGSTTLKVSAESIGSEYNIDKGSNFTVSNYPASEVDAIADSAFTGGSSREITAVSQADLDSLESELIAQLKQDGSESIKGQIGSGKQFIADSIQVGDITKNFNHKVGDEASTVKLEASVTFTGLAVDSNELFQLASNALSSTVPDGYSFKDDQLKISYNFINEENGKWYFDAQFEANLLPHVDTEEIKDKIAGKYPPQALDYLSTVPGYVRAEVNVNPALPGKLANLPHVHKNITVEVSSAR